MQMFFLFLKADLFFFRGTKLHNSAAFMSVAEISRGPGSQDFSLILLHFLFSPSAWSGSSGWFGVGDLTDEEI